MDEIADQWARERPDVPVASIGVVARVLRIAKVFADHRRRSLAELGIDSATFDLLATLRRSGAPFRMTPAELTRACLVTGGAISQRVTRAEAAGFVETRRTAEGTRRRSSSRPRAASGSIATSPSSSLARSGSSPT